MNKVVMWSWVVGGAVVFFIGAILLPLPIPFGAILMVLGLFLMSSHPRVMRTLRTIRARFPRISAKLRDVTPRLPKFLATFLRKTDAGNGSA